jgi:hypothetical protein
MYIAMAGQKTTRRQKDISRLLREKKTVFPAPLQKKTRRAPGKKAG